MTNWDLYKLLNFIVNKDVYAQAMNEDEFDGELKAKNIAHFHRMLGGKDIYQQGVMTFRVEATRINQQGLAPFLMNEEKTVAANGDVTISGIAYVLDFYTSTSRSADLISYQEFSSRVNDPQIQATSRDLFAYIINGGIKVFPNSTGNVNVIYYRQPNDPVFKITTNETTLEMSYDSAGSTELEWDEGNKMDILAMILKDFGINISRDEVVQVADKLIETGK